MAVTSTPVFLQTPKNGLTQITTGTGSSTLVTVYTGGVNGSKVFGLIGTAFATSAAFDVQFGITNGGTFFGVGTVLISCGAGSSDAVNAINMFNATNNPGLTLDSDGNPFVVLKSTADTLQAKTPSTSSQWAAGAVINLVAMTADY